MSKIICDDTLSALKNIPNETIDMGVTSPPYNKQENKKGWLVKNVKYNTVSDKLSESDYQKQQIQVLNELYRTIKLGGSFFYNHKIRWERGELIHPMSWLAQTNWTIRQEIVWDRNLAANIRGWRFWQVEERIYWLYKPVNDKKIGKELLSKHAKLTSIWRFMPESKNPHPAPFPLTLPLRAIYAIMDDNKGTIIDPYAGSGTTLLAAKLLGHDYIGIDISKEYIDMAKDRINNSQNEQEIFEREIEKHKVKDTFDNKKKQNKHVGKFAPRKEDEQARLF